MRRISKIYIHHSAMPDTMGLEQIRKLHLDRGFENIGYHFVIDNKGKTWQGRNIEKQGAHVKKDNADSIGICVCGNFEEKIPLPIQIKALEELIATLYKKFGYLEILGHKDHQGSDTLCPGQYLYQLLPDLRAKAKNQTPKHLKNATKSRNH